MRASPRKASPTITREVWPFMGPLIVGRALALLRCPDGITGQQFFQKHAWKGLSSSIVVVEDPQNPGEPLDQHPRSRRPDRPRAGGGRSKSIPGARPRPIGSGRTRSSWISIPAKTSRGQAMIEAARDVRARLEAAGARRFRQDFGRKGPACRRAGEAQGRLAGGQGVHQGDRRRDGVRQPAEIRRDHRQGEADAARFWSTICATSAA